MNDLAGTDHTPLPVVEHEEGSWCWSVSSSDASKQYPRWLEVEVSAHGGGVWIALNDGGDSMYLDEPRWRALLDALIRAGSIAGIQWQGGPERLGAVQ